MYHSAFPASNAIDGDDYNTLAASNYQTNAWLSVETPASSRIGLVAVYNRNDGEIYQNLLGSFEVGVGSAAGTISFLCGDYSGATNSVGPFVLNCGGTSVGRWVTVRQVGAARYLTPTGLRVYMYV